MEQLHRNADHRFIYVEMAFFSRWWQEQDDVTRHMVKGLVNAGILAKVSHHDAMIILIIIIALWPFCGTDVQVSEVVILWY